MARMPHQSETRPAAACFPVDIHIPNRTVDFLDIDEAVLERSTFLDNRIDAPLGDARTVALDALSSAPMPSRIGWLFHTSFCCSTLLARALHVPGRQVVLKEPLVLRRLGDARRAGWPVDEWIAPMAGLLGRAWSAQGSVVVKPTHAALNVAADLIHATPTSHALVLSSSLEDFLVSNLKKTTETLQKIPELAERALSATSLGPRLPAQALAPPHLLAAAVLQWAGQRELCAALVARFGTSRIRTLEAERLLADVPDSTVRVARWLGSTVDDEAHRRRARCVAGANAKATSLPYDAARRAEEAATVRERNAFVIDESLQWAHRWVLPFMSSGALDFPREWSVEHEDANRMVA